jgi:predicted ester cyclase
MSRTPGPAAAQFWGTDFNPGVFDELAARISGAASLIADGDDVVGQWEGGGTQTGDAFDDMPVGSLPAGTGKVLRFTGITVLKVENGQITEEIGLDDGLTALRLLGLITAA